MAIKTIVVGIGQIGGPGSRSTRGRTKEIERHSPAINRGAMFRYRALRRHVFTWCCPGTPYSRSQEGCTKWYNYTQNSSNQIGALLCPLPQHKTSSFFFFHYEDRKKSLEEVYFFEDLVGHFDGTYQQ